MVYQCPHATLLWARLCLPFSLPLYALTMLAFTVQDLEGLHQPVSSAHTVDQQRLSYDPSGGTASHTWTTKSVIIIAT